MPTYAATSAGKAVALKLPSFLGPTAYVPIEGFTEWWQRMQGRYQWCGTCRVARLTAHHDAHRLIHHRNWKGWAGGHYELSTAKAKP